jgi:hypothetical protein
MVCIFGLVILKLEVFLNYKHLQPSDVGAGSERLYGACVVHHGMDEHFVQQDPAPDGETASPVQERTQHCLWAACFLTSSI